MKISVSDAKGRLTDLVRRAEAGHDVVLTRHGHPAVRLVPVRAATDRKSRLRILDEIGRRASAKITKGPSADRSQDFLYGDDGLPK